MLEMLWESDDPAATLAATFGLPDGTAAVGWLTATLTEHWGISPDSCERIVMSDTNALAWVSAPGGRLIAKWSVEPVRFPRLAQVARLTGWLADRGLPVSSPVPACDGRLQVETGGVSMGVQRVIAGDLLATDDPTQVRTAGATLARLHEGLAAYAGPSDALGAAPLALRDRITAWLESYPAHLPTAGRDVLRTLLSTAPVDSLPMQLVHGDFRAANLLLDGGEVAAVLDFEEARLDHPIVELARSAVLLGTRFRGWAPVSAQVRAEFLAGYRTERNLTRSEIAWWDLLVLWKSLLMVGPGEDPTGWGTAAMSLATDLAHP